MDNNIINIQDNCKLKELFAAIDFAAFKHRYQKRKGLRPVPYINHPISVAKHLLDHMDDAGLVMLQAAILHDTLEDTKTTREELSQKFGEIVSGIVGELTDNMALTYKVRKRLQVEHAHTLSFEAGCIKIADKYCNVYDILSTRLGWPRQRKIRYVKWAIEVVRQIPHKDTGLEKSFYEIIDYAKKVLNTEF